MPTTDAPSTTQTTGKPYPHRDELETTLSACVTLRTSIIDESETRMQAIEHAENTLPSAEYLAQEAQRLRETFSAGGKPRGGIGTVVQRAHAAVYRQELVKLCNLIESQNSPPDILRDTPVDQVPTYPVPDVKAELERAWNADQSEILSTKQASLDEVGNAK
jgi:hypothetical protein